MSEEQAIRPDPSSSDHHRLDAVAKALNRIADALFRQAVAGERVVKIQQASLEAQQQIAGNNEALGVLLKTLQGESPNVN